MRDREEFPPSDAKSCGGILRACSTDQGDHAAWRSTERPIDPLDGSTDLRDLLDSLTDAAIVTDPDLDAPGPLISYVNPAFERMTGYASSEAVGRSPRFLQGDASDRAVLDNMRAELERAGRFDGHTINYRADGSPFLIEWRIKALRDRNGRLTGWLSLQRDLTSLKRAADEQRRLAREVDHRAKNALALVQGIVRLTRSADPDRYAAAVQGRVEALATAHALLSEATWGGVPLKRLVDAEVAQQEYERVETVGPPVSLAARLVQPVALVLHEMVCNAVEHGALSSGTGRVTVEWALDEADALRIEWLERGGPTPAAERRPGFGRAMINAIVTRQLAGRVEECWDNEGLRAALVIPLSRASAAPS